MSLKSVVEKIPGYNKLVLPWHWWQAVRASRKYQHPAKNLQVIGVTGTNGKTTTSFIIWKMLNEAGHKTGLLTTVGWGGVGDSSFLRTASSDNQKLDATILHRQYEHMTTERVDILNQRMRAIVDVGAEFLVLEVTSHALVQYRTWGVPIEVAVFTNLTHEHLDYHKTFANYRKAKLKLFRQAKYGVVNADDENAGYFTDIYASGDIITYGIKQGDLRATDIKLKPTGVEYSCGDIRNEQSKIEYSHDDTEQNGLKTPKYHIKTQIPGEFNVYNSLAAVAVGQKLGLSKAEIEQGIYALKEVEGRMNRIDVGQDFEVIVDYAHTPDALEKVFASVKMDNPKNEKKPKIITVHGGAGRRDESTRAMRGEILGKNSDIVIITEDDSRDEDPAKIAAQFVEGAERAGKVMDKDLYVDLDRRSAIEQALRLARANDLVLVLGKGHEKTILRVDGPHDFEDVKVVRELLAEMLPRAKAAAKK